MADPVLRGFDVLLFGVLGAWFVGRLVAGADLADRASSLLHLLMSVAMLAMPLPWAPPAAPQVVVFTLGALWYAGLALFRPSTDADLGVGHAGHSAGALWYHAAMMLSMLWMAVAMTPATPTAMAGMTMGATPSMAIGDMTGGAPWGIALSVGVGIGFAVAGVWFVARIVRLAVGNPGRLAVADLTASTLMAGGMSFAFLALMT